MKNLFKSLPFRLLLAVIVGVLLGLIFNGTILNFDFLAGFNNKAMNVVVTVKYIMGQFIGFCVPLIIIGFIAPSITKLGSNASKILGVAVLIAYLSSLGAGVFSMVSGYAIIPSLSIESSHESLYELPDLIFKLSIPQIMPVMSALVLSIVVGLAAAWTKAKHIANILFDFQKVVLSVVKKMVIPLLPFFIGFTFITLAYEGTFTEHLPVFIIVILIVIVGQLAWLTLLYVLAGIYSGKDPFKVVKNYGPAYMTAVGTMSSAATLAVSLECAHKSEPTLRDDMVDFGVPLFANIHLCGSVLTEVFFVMVVSQVLYGSLPELSSMILFCVLLGIFAVGAPGVPGGTVMASLGLITGVLGFDETGTALMLTIFALQDSFGTACNVTGDGALSLFLTGFVEKRKMEKQNLSVDL